MANQINVTSGTGNIQVTTSRSVIAVTTVANANLAVNVTGNAQPNITSVGNLTSLNITGTTTTGNLVVQGNLQVGNLVANSANYANFAGTANIANTVAGANVTGTVANATYAVSAGTANSATVAASANSVAGANVTGTVANATFASTSNVSNSATVAASANSVAVANVSGIGNIATVNLDGNSSNVLFGNGTFGPETATGNANYANFAGTAFSVSGSNVSGTVANATFATSAGTANSATVAASANSVAGANVTGTVANATFATSAGSANSATVANSANAVAGANVSGTVANATYADNAGNANTANSATVAASANSVAVANVTGIGNIATINLDGNASNVLRGDGTFSAEAGNLNANFANFAGNVTVSSQPNITSTGNLTSFQVGNGSNDTLKFTPTGTNLVLATANVVVAQNRTTTTTAPIDAVVVPSNVAISTYTQQYFAPLGSNVGTFASTIYSLDANANVSNAAAVGSITHRAFTGDSTLANADTGSTLDFAVGVQGGVLVTQKMPLSTNAGPAGTGIIQTLSYGESANQAASTALRFQRRRGNNNSRASLQANDYIGNIEWRAARSGTQYGTFTAKLSPRVDSSYTTGNIVPIGMEMVVCNTSSQITHNFYANGNVSFASAITANGAITATNIGNVANTNFNGNGSSVLLGNGVFGSAPTSTPTQIVNGNSSVSFTGAGGDLNINIDGRQFAQFNYGRQLVLTGVSGDYTNASLMKLNNGTMQIINEDLGGGLPSFEFKSYYTTGGAIAPYVFQRARGTFASPANAQTGDSIMNQTFQAYSGSGFVGAGSFGATVTNNDNAGNVRSRVELSTSNDNDGSEIKFTTDVITLEGNSLIELNATNSNVSGNLNVAGNITYTRTFGSFTSNVTQTNSNVGNAIYMTLNNNEGSNGVSIVSSSQITIAKPGRYNLQFSAQLEKTDSGTDEVEVWLTKNGTAVANSATRLAQQGNNVKGVAAWNWLLDATTANTYYQIAWGSTDANMQLVAIDSANTLSGVAVPSIIVTVVPVGA